MQIMVFINKCEKSVYEQVNSVTNLISKIVICNKKMEKIDTIESINFKQYQNIDNKHFDYSKINNQFI